MPLNSEAQPLRDCVAKALLHSNVWKDYRVEAGPASRSLLFVAPRDAGDITPEVLVEFCKTAELPSIAVSFSEQHEEDRNEGIHDILSGTYNLLRYANRCVPELGFDGSTGVFKVTFRGEVSTSEVWMFCRD